MRRTRETSFSTLAFIDVMACGLGAVILLFFILDFEEPVAEDPVSHVVVTSSGDSRPLEAEYESLLAQKELRLRSVEAKTKAVSDSLIQLLKIVPPPVEKIEKSDKPSVATSSVNKSSQLIGLSVGGSNILIVLDTSASMADTRLVEIISGLSDPSGKRLEQGTKWKRAKRIARWLIEQAPQSSSVKILGYSDRITFDTPSWKKPDEILKSYDRTILTVTPENGTSLAVALEHIQASSYHPSDIYLVTDGLPTLSGKNSPLFALSQLVKGCFNLRKRNSFVTGDCRRMLFQSAVADFQETSNARVHVVLLPLEGDPEAAYLYQHWANLTGGTLLSPAVSWLK